MGPLPAPRAHFERRPVGSERARPAHVALHEKVLHPVEHVPRARRVHRLDPADAAGHLTQQQLGDVVYMELPEVGSRLTAGQSFGSIESVKAVSELFAPVSGEVTEVHSALVQHPETVNKDPHGAWMIKVKVADPGDVGELLDSAQYTDLTK